MLAVGYDEKSWIIKNRCAGMSTACSHSLSLSSLLLLIASSPVYSWGATWGNAGHFRLSTTSKHSEGACGVLSAASYPVKRHDNPTDVPSFCGKGEEVCWEHVHCCCCPSSSCHFSWPSSRLLWAG